MPDPRESEAGPVLRGQRIRQNPTDWYHSVAWALMCELSSKPCRRCDKGTSGYQGEAL
jgi:hypothetical protein